MATFDFCPDRNVPETLPRDAPQSTMSMNSWQFSARPTTPYQRKFKLTLHGLRWYLNSDNTYDSATNRQFNARAVEQFYELYETWAPFILPHQHFGDIIVRFASPLIVPASEVNANGLIKPVEVTFIEHNPSYRARTSTTPNLYNTRANSTAVYANKDGFKEALQSLEAQLIARGG